MTEPTTQPVQPQHTPHQEHPTAELPALSSEQAAELLAAGEEEPKKRLWEVIANQLVTLLLAIAVFGVLAVNVGPLVLPYKVYTVLSGSMVPAIPVGAEVVAVPTPAPNIKVGDVITFQPPGRANILVTHRVIKIITGGDGAPLWLTKGDANGVADIWQIPAAGSGLREVFSVPYLGYAFAMLESPFGRIMFILAPALLLAAVTLNDLWKPKSARVRPAQPKRS